MHNFLIAVSSLLAAVSYVVYAQAILKGEAKPHRTTRGIALLITALATVSLLAKGSTVAIWLSGIFTLGSAVIFLFTLKFGMGGWAKTDILCLIVSLVGILFWKMTANPLYGLCASVVADFVGEIPMLIKTYRYPETEVWSFYLIDVFAALLSLLALQQWTPQEYLYPLYIMLLDCSIVFLILRAKIFKRFGAFLRKSH